MPGFMNRTCALLLVFGAGLGVPSAERGAGMWVEFFGVLTRGVLGWVAGSDGSGSILGLALEQGSRDGDWRGMGGVP